MEDEAITLETLGWNAQWEARFADLRAKGLEPARVAVEDKHHYVVLNAEGDWSAVVAGKVLHRAESPADLPKVGDWVAISRVPHERKVVIQQVLPRQTKLSRKVPGREVEEQVLVTNVDVVFIVQALDRPMKAALLERHLVMVHETGARPVVVFNKADLAEDASEVLHHARAVAGETPVEIVSAKTGQAMDELCQFIAPGTTVVFIGPSGVGKSSLINQLYGEEIQATTEVRESDCKGRHTTTWRELILLPGGGLVIDTPGMREFQIWQADQGLHETFSEIDELAVQCHFRDCTHTVEKRCAVLAAVENGTLPHERYESYLKLRRELAHLQEAQHRHVYLERKRQTKIAQRAFKKFKREM
jgi:ribosome biogenesis GTPase / thiamine phosphate phosphatase